MMNCKKITPISAETKAMIKRKSAHNLPNRPSERGMKPDDIKRALYAPMVDEENSIISEMERVISEANGCFESVFEELESSEPDPGKEGYSKEQIDAMFGAYATDMAKLIGGDALE